jgi:hypothetical protein
VSGTTVRSNRVQLELAPTPIRQLDGDALAGAAAE